MLIYVPMLCRTAAIYHIVRDRVNLCLLLDLTTVSVCVAVLIMKYFFDHYGFTSSGAIAALVQGLLAKELWKRGLPRIAAGLSPSLHILSHALCAFLFFGYLRCPDACLQFSVAPVVFS